MADELHKLLYQTIVTSSDFITIANATTQDPRVYKRKTPVRIQGTAKLTATSDQPLYVVYRLGGTTHLPSGSKVEIGQIDDRTYMLEVYGIKDTQVDDACQIIWDLFDEKQFLTDSFKVGYTWATRGTMEFDDGRQQWIETMMVYFKNILRLTSP